MRQSIMPLASFCPTSDETPVASSGVRIAAAKSFEPCVESHGLPGLRLALILWGNFNTQPKYV
ncbi:hypothetical protein IF1G_06173 [Cordyceps javanica]|uniref:Uncharacterized protein n=1 Tax=Cordyceps javanica TaxID=43265 RepID=A0A545V0E1_9HYPO|nr:hypothetical protein IF1G_06173 [Cordyceps javanica]